MRCSGTRHGKWLADSSEPERYNCIADFFKLLSHWRVYPGDYVLQRLVRDARGPCKANSQLRQRRMHPAPPLKAPRARAHALAQLFAHRLAAALACRRMSAHAQIGILHERQARIVPSARLERTDAHEYGLVAVENAEPLREGARPQERRQVVRFEPVVERRQPEQRSCSTCPALYMASERADCKALANPRSRRGGCFERTSGQLCVGVNEDENVVGACSDCLDSGRSAGVHLARSAAHLSSAAHYTRASSFCEARRVVAGAAVSDHDCGGRWDLCAQRRDGRSNRRGLVERRDDREHARRCSRARACAGSPTARRPMYARLSATAATRRAALVLRALATSSHLRASCRPHNYLLNRSQSPPLPLQRSLTPLAVRRRPRASGATAARVRA